jgi:hypothetical protein
VRSALTIVLLAVAVALIFTSGEGEPAVPPARGPAEGWDEATEWAVLCPRGTGTSQAPIVAFMTPGWLGAVEVTIEAPGRTSVSVTTERSVAWPEALRPLAIGEWCAVTIAGAGLRGAESAYLRIAPEAENSLPGASGGLGPLPDSPPSDTMPRAREW